MAIDLMDEREYAWLLVRPDTLTGEFLQVWKMIPIRSESVLSAVFGFPIRLVTLLGTLFLTGLLMLVALIGMAQLPVKVFAYLHHLLPDWAWLAILGMTVLCLVGYLAYAMAVWLQAAAAEDDQMAGKPSNFTARAQAPPVDTAGGWNRWQSLHVSHESSRNGLFAGLSIAMAMLLHSSAFKIRELFSGTTRDLADHLENFDISGDQRLMIHRVAVLRPLDEAEVVSLTEKAFLERVKEGMK